MEQEVKITNREWTKLTSRVDKVDKQSNANLERLNRHSKRIDELEDNQIKLPISIQKAVENGMAPVLEKVLAHDQKFSNIELNRERERAEIAERVIEESKEKKRWLVRIVIAALIAVFVTSVIGGVISFYIAVFLNNLGGG
ncbi:hypothetical protein [Paenilisteria rocourtiae]|uniref:Uncharacterized protein n=1 Tax=Listeria rocourtiae TaxID=647910 RepID=A0A4R6ZHH1_9LIST|nr:hypothetical protein [Listeria rocourtiae]EUJ46656.1 hypothetical protein PROCOU_11093 [Listeria rocourtiae FSL F6-920]TDR51741.1 hypothetical protein DFP96_11147 [Listeria rocourtiae]